MGRAINQRAAAEAYAQSKGYTPSQPGYWSLVCGVLTGHLAERDDEQAAAATPAHDATEVRRIYTIHRRVEYAIDYHVDEYGDAEVGRVWHRDLNILDLLDGEAPEWAQDAADYHCRDTAAEADLALRAAA